MKFHIWLILLLFYHNDGFNIDNQSNTAINYSSAGKTCVQTQPQSPLHRTHCPPSHLLYCKTEMNQVFNSSDWSVEIRQLCHNDIRKLASSTNLTSLLSFTFGPHSLYGCIHGCEHGVCSGFPRQNVPSLLHNLQFPFSHLKFCRTEMNKILYSSDQSTSIGRALRGPVCNILPLQYKILPCNTVYMQCVLAFPNDKKWCF